MDRATLLKSTVNSCRNIDAAEQKSSSLYFAHRYAVDSRTIVSVQRYWQRSGVRPRGQVIVIWNLAAAVSTSKIGPEEHAQKPR